MTWNETKLQLEGRGIDTNNLSKYFVEYYKKYTKDYKYYTKRLNIFTYKTLNSLYFFCTQFKEYFDDIEYSKFVCKVFVSFSRIHCAYLTGNDKDPDLYAGKYATPCKPLPPNLVVVCTSSGIVKISKDNLHLPLTVIKAW